jgi:hypothetical protein
MMNRRKLSPSANPVDSSRKVCLEDLRGLLSGTTGGGPVFFPVLARFGFDALFSSDEVLLVAVILRLASTKGELES